MAAKKKSQGTTEPHLKGKNAAYLWSFIAVNLAVFLCLLVAKGISEASLDHSWQRVASKNGLIAIVIPVLAIVLAGVFGDTGKARLVFWRWRNALPGCRAFTRLLATDPRIDVPALRKRLGEFPGEAGAQNALWYRLYKAHRMEVRVVDAHKNYLLTRDMAAMSALFLVLFSAGVLLARVPPPTALLYIAALVGQYGLVAIAARNYGTRFVANVLVEESQLGGA